jgi:hypothetical protein
MQCYSVCFRILWVTEFKSKLWSVFCIATGPELYGMGPHRSWLLVLDCGLHGDTHTQLPVWFAQHGVYRGPFSFKCFFQWLDFPTISSPECFSWLQEPHKLPASWLLPASEVNSLGWHQWLAINKLQTSSTQTSTLFLKCLLFFHSFKTKFSLCSIQYPALGQKG